MRKDRAFGLLFLVLLLFVLGGVSAQNVPDKSSLSLNCGALTMKGEWVRDSGPSIVVEGKCTVIFDNPTNTSVKYDYTYWETLKFTPMDVDFGYYPLKLPGTWVNSGETLRHNLSMRGEVKGIPGFIKLVMARRILISGKGDIVAVTKEDRAMLIPFSVNAAAPVRIEWGSVFLVISAFLAFFLWFIFGISMAVATREDEAKVTGWGVLASYGIIAIPFTGVIMILNIETQLFTLLSMEFLLLAIWLSIANRTTPEKSESVTRLLGNAVLLSLGLSVLAAISGGYLEGSSWVAAGIIFLIVILIGASYYLLSALLGEEERKGKIPRINTFPIGIALFLLAYPVLAVFILVGWTAGVIITSFTTALLFAIGSALTRKAEKSKEIEFKSL